MDAGGSDCISNEASKPQIEQSITICRCGVIVVKHAPTPCLIISYYSLLMYFLLERSIVCLYIVPFYTTHLVYRPFPTSTPSYDVYTKEQTSKSNQHSRCPDCTPPQDNLFISQRTYPQHMDTLPPYPHYPHSALCTPHSTPLPLDRSDIPSAHSANAVNQPGRRLYSMRFSNSSTIALYPNSSIVDCLPFCVLRIRTGFTLCCTALHCTASPNKKPRHRLHRYQRLKNNKYTAFITL